MRIVADTNTIVSGLLWSGPPQELINAARAKRITLYSSVALTAEFAEVIGREQFAKRLRAARLSAAELVSDYARLAKFVIPADINPTVAGDADDDQVLACALAASADAIVSGDKHLRNLKTYQNIPVINAVEALARLSQR
ncbi:MAG TPA: putative toxin-antitoxin system toxin component, PIN family [Burkholderiales bacterium]|nr:putative toxin-antitoxin system toxin component, PIN family [Burkholderiales bacterium]